MRPLFHFAASLPFAIPFIFLFSTEYAVVFVIWSVMLDFDHVIMVYKNMGQLSLNPFTEWNLIKERIEKIYQTKEQTIEPFHLTEFWLVTLPLASFWPILIPIVISSLFHILLDLVENVLDTKKDLIVKRRILTVYQVIYKFHKAKSS